MDLPRRLANVNKALTDNQFTLASFINEVLARTDQPERESLAVSLGLLHYGAYCRCTYIDAVGRTENGWLSSEFAGA